MYYINYIKYGPMCHGSDETQYYPVMGFTTKQFASQFIDAYCQIRDVPKSSFEILVVPEERERKNILFENITCLDNFLPTLNEKNEYALIYKEDLE